MAIALELRSYAAFCDDALHIANPGAIPLPRINGSVEVDNRNPVPVPSVLDFQLDTMAITHMRELLGKVVKRMRRMLYQRSGNKRYWYEVYLCTFVLLHTLGDVYRHQEKIIRESAAMVIARDPRWLTYLLTLLRMRNSWLE